MRRQSGQGKLGCIIWLVLAGGAGYAAYKMLPVRIASAELYDHCEELARFKARRPPDVLRADIFKKAKYLDLPLTLKNIKVERHGRRIRIEYRYTVLVNFGFTVYEWEFHERIDREIFMI